MTEQKHTPGPWHVRGRLIEADRHTVAALSKVTDCDLLREESEANARLIAAAPELLEACETCLRLLESEDLDANKFDGEARRKLVPRLPSDLARRRSQAALLRAAVAKATG
jgi:hypothetical protein